MKTNQVFISHSSKDKPFVDRIVKDLAKVGIQVWYDKFDINLGDSIPGKINEGLAASKYFFIVLSSNSVNSKWVIEELNAATIKQVNMSGTFIIPILIEDCTVPPLLMHRAFADFRTNYNDGRDKIISFLGKDKLALDVVGDKTLYPWPDYTLTDKQFVYLYSERFDKFFKMSCDFNWSVDYSIDYIVSTLNLPWNKELPEFGMRWSFNYGILFNSTPLTLSQKLSEVNMQNGNVIKLTISGVYEDLIGKSSQDMWSEKKTYLIYKKMSTGFANEKDSLIKIKRGNLTQERLREIANSCFSHV